MAFTGQMDLEQRLLDDDEQVLEDILRRFGPAVSSLLLRRYRGILTEADCDDLLSIGLFRLWNARQRFDRRKSSLKVWFFRIVENAACDVLRLGWQQARIRETELPHAAWVRVADPGPGDNGRAAPDGGSAATALQVELRRIVAALPEMQQKIIAADAAARDGTASSRWLAAQLGVTASTVRVYRKRAMDTIRQELTRRGYDVPQTPTTAADR